jgi:hypothetical protein
MKDTSKATVVTLPFQNAKGEIEHRAQFSLSEANKLTGVPVSQYRKLCRSGVLNPVTGFGRKWYLSAEDLLRLFNHRLRNHQEGA